MNKLGAEILRNKIPTDEEITALKRNDIYIILDNVLDTYNIGAIFRLADAVGAKKIYLCGDTETPPNSRIEKASVNTYHWTKWEYFADAVSAISNVKSQIPNIQVVAIELTPDSVPYDTFEYKLPIALVVGHESFGVSEETLKACDAVVDLPMLGINKSLNVMVSLGIVLYEVIEKTVG
jgi:23S rRNA (guanosine2251-2'-O)-methyltransferase